ncbi:MAG TPA: DUF5979 domain-containing protein, partial [Acidimicrobiales bacterium]|nr:DUF5979 domain-containing protein [Acidimicrobiales bacterium]
IQETNPQSASATTYDIGAGPVNGATTASFTVSGDRTVAFANTYPAAVPAGSATITKTVVGDRAPSPGNYEICLTPATGAVQCKTLTRNGAGTVSDTWAGLAAGTWTLTEKSATDGTNGAQPTTTITTATITVPAGGTATGSLTNDYGNNPVINNPPPPPTTVPSSSPRIEVVKTGASGNPDISGTVVYTYLVRNTGDTTLTTITLGDDKLGALTLPVESLAPGASTSVTALHVVTAADLDAGSLTNIATTEGTAPNGTTVTDTDAFTVEFPARRGLTVDKSTNTIEAAAGDTITYTYVVTNTGNVTISDLSMFDDKIGEYFDADLAGISLGAGESVTVTMDYTVTEQDALSGSVTNVAVANGDLPRDLGPIRGDDTVTVPVGKTIVKNTGFLTVSKQIDGTHEDKPYTFEVDCAGIALGRAGSFSIKPGGGDHEVGVAVPEGTQCTVTETRDGGADGTTVAVNDGRAKSGREATITIAEGTNLVTFANAFELAPIVVPDDPPKKANTPKEPTLPATGASSMVQLLIALASLSMGGTLVRTTRRRPAKKGWLRA